MNARVFLKNQFDIRKQKNPRYSLRAFARLLKTDPSSLSRIMRGERVPSLATLDKWRLCMGVADSEMPVDSHRKDFYAPLGREFADTQLTWLHPLILEATRMESFQKRKASVSRSLGISEAKLEETLALMEHLGAIVKSTDGDISMVRSFSTFNLTSTSKNRKDIQKKYLEMAQNSLENTPFEKRCNSTLSIALSEEDIPKAREILKNARKQIARLSRSKSKKLNVVYNVTTALYPVAE